MNNFIVIFVTPKELVDTMETHELQAILMERFFQEVDGEAIQAMSEGQSYHDICQWNLKREKPFTLSTFKAECVEGDLYTILISFIPRGNFHIGFLPNALVSLQINDSLQSYVLDTRRLPRDLRNLLLQYNRIFGSLNLQSLPLQIEQVMLRGNLVSGPIALVGLHQSSQP